MSPAVGVDGVERYKGRWVVSMYHGAQYQPRVVIVTAVCHRHLTSGQTEEPFAGHVGVHSAAPVVEVDAAVVLGEMAAAVGILYQEGPFLWEGSALAEVGAVAVGGRWHDGGADRYAAADVERAVAGGVNGEDVAGVG